MSIYYKEEDQYLIDRLEVEANRGRKSKSAMILSILEEYFEAEKKMGQILKDMRAIDNEKLNQALDLQKEKDGNKSIGEIMVQKGYVKEVDLERALQIQAFTANKGVLSSPTKKREVQNQGR